MAAVTDHPDQPIRVLRFDAPIDKLVSETKEMPSAKIAEGATKPEVEKAAKETQPQAGGQPADAAPGEAQQSSVKGKEIGKVKKGKQFSVGDHPAGGTDILNEIEGADGVRTKGGAVAKGGGEGGEYDGIKDSFTGRARLLLRRQGVTPDQMAKQFCMNLG